jgi:hypothetical protein
VCSPVISQLYQSSISQLQELHKSCHIFPWEHVFPEFLTWNTTYFQHSCSSRMESEVTVPTTRNKALCQWLSISLLWSQQQHSTLSVSVIVITTARWKETLYSSTWPGEIDPFHQPLALILRTVDCLSLLVQLDWVVLARIHISAWKNCKERREWQPGLECFLFRFYVHTSLPIAAG